MLKMSRHTLQAMLDHREEVESRRIHTKVICTSTVTSQLKSYSSGFSSFASVFVFSYVHYFPLTSHMPSTYILVWTKSYPAPSTQS